MLIEARGARTVAFLDDEEVELRVSHHPPLTESGKKSNAPGTASVSLRRRSRTHRCQPRPRPSGEHPGPHPPSPGSDLFPGPHAQQRRAPAPPARASHQPSRARYPAILKGDQMYCVDDLATWSAPRDASR